MPVKEEEKTRRPHLHWRAWHTSLAAGGIVAATLAAAGPAAGSAWIVGALALATGTLAGVSHARRWRLLLASIAVATIIAVLSALDFLRADVEGRFAAVAATFAVYLVLGFITGGLVETVFFLHYLSHGGKPSAYPNGAKGE